jgi:tetratricopeptide (TPR) repeat protein
MHSSGRVSTPFSPLGAYQAAERKSLDHALAWALAAAIAITLALLGLGLSPRPAAAQGIPQVPMLLETVLKMENIELVRRDDRLGIGNLIVKHPPRVKAEPGEPNYESWGSAFLIGKCHILTARHVIDPDDPDNHTNDLPLKSKIEFVIGPIRDQTKVHKANDLTKLSQILDSTKATPVAWGQYTFTESQDETKQLDAAWKSFPEDWALLKLEKCLGDGPKGYIPLALNGITTAKLMETAEPIPARGISGPPEAGLSHLIDDKNCFIFGQVEWPIWSNDCYGKPGSSGAPILEPDGNGGWRVVALVTRGPTEWTLRAQLFSNSRPKGWPWRIQYMPMANPVSGFLDRIKPLLADDAGVRMAGAGTNKPYEMKDPALVAHLAKLRAARPEDMALTVRWLIAKYMTEGAEPTLSEIDRLLIENPAAREPRSVRVDIALYDRLTHSTAVTAAIADLKKFREDFPELAELQVIQGLLMAQSGDCQNGANLLRKTWDRHGIDPTIRLDWTDAMACAGQHRAALAAYDEMLRLAPKYERAQFTRAVVRFRLGQSEPARSDLRKILKENPQALWAQTQRAIFALNEGHHLEEAEKDLRAAIADTADNPEPAFALGAGFLAQGRDADAVEVLKTAVAYNKKHDVFPALLLAVALTKTGQKDAAKAALDGLIEPHDDPQHWEVMLVKHYLGEMSADDFLKEAEKGPEDTRWTRLGRAHAYVALLAYAKGEKKDARRYFATAPYLDRSWSDYSVIDTWHRAAEG